MKEKIDRQEKILTRLLEWIRAADSRFPPLAAINTAMLGTFAALTPNLSEWTPGLIIVASITAVLLTVSFFCLGIAMFPRTKGPPSVIFFEGIQSRDSESYQAAISGLTDTDYLADLIGQSHRNAEIAHLKFLYVRFAMIAWFISILPWSLALWRVVASTGQA